MTDDLVKRLRGIAVHSYLGRSVIEEAAHRIEQLERELSISRMAQVVMDNGAEALEQDNHRWKMECENFWRDREKALTAERDKYESAWMTAEGKLADVEAERDRLRAALEDIADHDTGATAGLAYTAKIALKGDSND